MLIPITSRSSGIPPASFNLISSGTSTLQCGHQWARNTSIVGLSDAPPIVIGVPSKLCARDDGGCLTDRGIGGRILERRERFARDLDRACLLDLAARVTRITRVVGTAGGQHRDERRGDDQHDHAGHDDEGSVLGSHETVSWIGSVIEDGVIECVGESDEHQ